MCALLLLLPVASVSFNLFQFLAPLALTFFLGVGALYFQWRTHRTQQEQVSTEREQATLERDGHEQERDLGEQRLALDRERQRDAQLTLWMDQARVSRDEAILQREELKEAREESRLLAREVEELRQSMETAVMTQVAHIRSEYEQTLLKVHAIEEQNRLLHIEVLRLRTLTGDTSAPFPELPWTKSPSSNPSPPPSPTTATSTTS